MIVDRKVKNFSEALLSKYFTFDGKTATVDLYYDTFEELIENNVGNDSVEMLNGTLFGKLDEIFALLPRKYEINLNLHIKDMGEYKLEETKQIIIDNIALKIHAFILERRRKNITGLSLLLSGCVLLIISYLLGRLNWPQIVYDVINISGTLFVWEAADVALIERTAEAKRAKQYIKKFKCINVTND